MARAKYQHPLRRSLKILLLACAVMLAIPILLTPLYIVVNPISVPMLYRYVTFQPVKRDWVEINSVSDRLKASVMMSEDGQFCRHMGVDLGALRAEFNAWRNGKSPRGASTLTMQVARNLFLWNGRSYIRKALEIPLAAYIDLIMPKRRIFEIYLNIAEWGPGGEFGIAAGTHAAFGADTDAFSWERATLMAVTLPNPHLRNPAKPNAGMRRVAAIIGRRALNSQPYISCLYHGNQPQL